MNNRPADFNEARWRRLMDALAADESLSDSEREFLARFCPRSAEGRAEAQLFSALARLGRLERDE
ncbi:MAG: hypothetical protein AAGF11_46385 [Myxococcota bacterium]